MQDETMEADEIAEAEEPLWPGTWPALMVALVAIFQFMVWPAVTPSGKDTNYYVEGARSIAEGRGYRHVMHAGEPPMRLYPPGQSAYLSIPWKLGGGQFPENYPALALAEGLGALGAVIALAWYLHAAGLGPWGTSAGVAVLGFSPMWTNYSHFLWSEPVYCAMAASLLVFLRRAVAKEDLRAWLAIGLLLMAMLAWRKAAVAFIGGAFAAALLLGGRKRWTATLAVLLPALAAGALWTALNPTPPEWSGGTYARGMQDQWQRLGGWSGYFGVLEEHLTSLARGEPYMDALFGAVTRAGYVSDLVPPTVAPWLTRLGKVAGIAIVGLTLLGSIRERSRANLAVALVVAAVVAEDTLWIWQTAGRLHLPIVGPVLAWAAWGARSATAKLPWKPVRFLALAGVGVLIAGNAWFTTHFTEFAEQRSAALRQFVREAAPKGLQEGELAVDVELSAPLVVREVGVRIANIPFADEHGSMWVPIQTNSPAPRLYLARTKLFDSKGRMKTIHGTYAIQARSADGTFCISALESGGGQP